VNDLDDIAFFAHADPQQLKGDVAKRCAEIVCNAHDMKKRVEQGVDNQLNGIGTALRDVYGKIYDRVNQGTAGATMAVDAVLERIEGILSARITAIEGAVTAIESKVATWEAKQRRAADRAAGRTKTQGIAPKPAQIGAGQAATAAARPSSSATPSMPAPMGSDWQTFPSPLATQQLQNLFIALPSQQSMIGLGDMPPEFFRQDHDLGWWFTLQPTPLARAQIQLVQVDGEAIAPGGTLFLNTPVNLTVSNLEELLQQFGLQPGEAVILDLGEAWNVLGEAFGPTLVGGVWDHFDLPHAPIAPPLQPIATYTREQVQEAIRDTVLHDEPLPENYPPRDEPANGPRAVQDREMSPLEPEDGSKPPSQLISTPGVPGAIPMPGIGQAVGQLIFPGLGALAGLDLCALARQIAVIAGYPPEVVPPCATMPQIAAWRQRLFRESGGSSQ